MAAWVLVLFFASLPARPADDEAALWSAIHLTAQAAIDAGSLARSRAVSPEIRNLGSLVVRDDDELDRRLRALSAKAGIALADGPKPGKIQFEELQKLQGVDFDRKFLNFTYGASEALLRQMHDGAQRSGYAPLRDLIALFDHVVRQDQFLSGWCLGHCVPASKP
jgi:predicted outer membrane protein